MRNMVLLKRCSYCKKEQQFENFKDNGKEYATCNTCRLKRIARKNICSICGVNAIFNNEGEKVGVRCSSHKEIGMINVKDPKCITCKVKRPSFNYEHEEKALYCKDCSLAGMINVRSRKCITCKVKQPSFNYEYEEKALYCKECSLAGMIDVSNFKCITCKVKHPIFNYEHEEKALYCKDCSLAGMIDVKNLKCITCKVKRPSFNYEHEEKALYCKDCSLAGMIDVKHHRCITCKVKHPFFNYEHEDKALYCKECSLAGMIDIKSRKCITCKVKRPTFNYEHEEKALYCKNCSLVGMVDIKNLKCHCGKRAHYNQPNMFPQFCTQHRTNGMIKNPRKKCLKCDQSACYGLERNKPLRCETHKLESDFLLTERVCINCGQLDVLTPSGKCVNFCSPDEKYIQLQKRVKCKEEFIIKLFDSDLDKTHVIFHWKDEIIESSCTNKRPDIVYHCGTHVVICEVDEHQHKSYTSCGTTVTEKKDAESRRMFEIFQQFQHPNQVIPVVFIRYNPDSFSSNGKTIKVRDQIRHNVLLRWMKHCLNTKDWLYPLQVKYLFYDGHDDTDTIFRELKIADLF